VKRSYQESERESRTKSMTAGVSYQMRRWFTLRLDGAWHDRSSYVESFVFVRSRYWVTAEFTLYCVTFFRLQMAFIHEDRHLHHKDDLSFIASLSLCG